jgi:hypothetical protein
VVLVAVADMLGWFGLVSSSMNWNCKWPKLPPKHYLYCCIAKTRCIVNIFGKGWYEYTITVTETRNPNKGKTLEWFPIVTACKDPQKCIDGRDFVHVCSFGQKCAIFVSRGVFESSEVNEIQWAFQRVRVDSLCKTVCICVGQKCAIFVSMGILLSPGAYYCLHGRVWVKWSEWYSMSIPTRTRWRSWRSPVVFLSQVKWMTFNEHSNVKSVWFLSPRAFTIENHPIVLPLLVFVVSVIVNVYSYHPFPKMIAIELVLAIQQYK